MRRKILLPIAALLLLVAGVLEAGPYNQVIVSIASSTVPVLVIPGGQKASWLLKPRAGSVTQECFSVATGAASPTAMPSAAMEVGVGAAMSDSVIGGSNAEDITVLQSSIWCADETGTGASVIDGWWR